MAGKEQFDQDALAAEWGLALESDPPTQSVGDGNAENGTDAMAVALDWAGENHLVRPGDRVVLVRGMVPGNPVQNAVLVHEVE